MLFSVGIRQSGRCADYSAEKKYARVQLFLVLSSIFYISKIQVSLTKTVAEGRMDSTLGNIPSNVFHL